jgi:murein DD-endopeptidase MepM/ murein hydrolase activator NlpD
VDFLVTRLRALQRLNRRSFPVAAIVAVVVLVGCVGVGTYFALGGGSTDDGSVTTVTDDTADFGAARSPKAVAAARIARAKADQAVLARAKAVAADEAAEKAAETERDEDVERARDEAVEAAEAAEEAAADADEARELAAALLARERAAAERDAEEQTADDRTRADDKDGDGEDAQASSRRAADERAGRHKRQVAGWSLPIDSYELTGRFGQSGNRWASSHHGLDFAAPSGTPIRAVRAGTIIAAGWDGAYGNRILVEHADGTVTLYGHMSRFERESGEVKAGTVIGEVGATGNVTGPHLHLEVRPNGGGLDDTIDPFEWLEDKGLSP